MRVKRLVVSMLGGGLLSVLAFAAVLVFILVSCFIADLFSAHPNASVLVFYSIAFTAATVWIYRSHTWDCREFDNPWFPPYRRR